MSLSMMNNTAANSFDEWLAHGKPGKEWNISETGLEDTSSAGSPTEAFNSLFDPSNVLGQQSDSDTLFTTSNDVSVMNSPTQVKHEDCEELKFNLGLLGSPLDFELLDSAVNAAAMRKDARAENDDGDDRTMHDKNNNNTNDDDTTTTNNNNNNNNNNSRNEKNEFYKPAQDYDDQTTYTNSIPDTRKRKRAPRKRLTPHQKEAHNKIEKRYRININTKIANLQQIIPWLASEKTAFEVGDALKSGGDDASAGTSKLNKSIILEKAVDYILYLQNNERLYQLEVQRLKSELATLKKGL
ncbi:HEL220Wp [Eremothecium sinecaudum]|uniref:HEL220Wp n=1 Tax=Eremothecium sinecaudum TaxID=45286 RepID=A0A109UZD0_9SACH|nr:HEL220Wp [Eremothecium sinecaudum]AMD21061.1 HEL220Wp [Eremothecium sinecaudum]